MYDDILFCDFCIAVLHGFNPNVFYELAVAHSAGVPVILLSEKGIDPPFDLKDERVFHYDLAPRAIHRGDNVRTLVAMIESVRKLQGRREVPFGSNLTPLNGTVADLPIPCGMQRTRTPSIGSDWSATRAVDCTLPESRLRVGEASRVCERYLPKPPSQVAKFGC
jgi:hypothetical protein